MFVILFPSRVSAVHLPTPPERFFHLTVFHALAIANHKMISNAQPLPGQVRLMNAFDIPLFRCRMMHHNRGSVTSRLTRIRDRFQIRRWWIWLGSSVRRFRLDGLSGW